MYGVIEIIAFTVLGLVAGWVFGMLVNPRVKVVREEAKHWKNMYLSMKAHANNTSGGVDVNNILEQVMGNPLLAQLAQRFLAKYGIDLNALVGNSSVNDKDKFINEWR